VLAEEILASSYVREENFNGTIVENGNGEHEFCLLAIQTTQTTR
jgi:hypothetical protein